MANFLLFERSKINIAARLLMVVVLLITSSLLFKATAQSAGTVPVTIPAGGFEIDGNLISDGVGDWFAGSPAVPGTYVLGTGGTPLVPGKTFHLVDRYTSPDDVFKSGEKLFWDPNIMTWEEGDASNKTNMNNALMHLATDANGDIWIIFAADRGSASGDAYIDFVFNQAAVTQDPDFTFGSAGPDAGRTDKDFVLTVAFGGGTASFEIWQWTFVGGAWKWAPFTPPPGAIGDYSFAAVNTSVITVPAGYTVFGGNTYPANSFVEGAINLSKIMDLAAPCKSLDIESIFIRSKSSSSDQANPEDFFTPLLIPHLTIGDADAGSDQSKCAPEGQPAVFTVVGHANPEEGYTIQDMAWSVPPCATISYPDGSWVTDPVTHTGTLTATISVPSDCNPATATLTVVAGEGAALSCTVTDEVVLTRTPAPTVTQKGNLTFCNGETADAVSFSGSSASNTYTWTSDTDLGFGTTGTSTIPSFVATNPGSSPIVATFSVTATLGDCTGASMTFTITVNPTLTITISGTGGPVCPLHNDSFSVPSGNTGYDWSITGNGDFTTATNTQSVTVKSRLSCNSSYTLTVSFTDTGGCATTASKTVTINDQTAPSINCPANVTVSCAGDIPAPDISAFTASDDCGGAVTKTFVGDVISGQTCANRYTVTRTYSATDACGNLATCTQIITVNDQTVPSISCPNNVTVSCSGNIPAPDISQVTASDLCGGTVTKVFVGDVISGQTCANRYTVTRTYSATDACGNTATCTQIITVNDNTAPVVTPPADALSMPCYNASTVATWAATASASDGCSGSRTVTPTWTAPVSNCSQSVLVTFTAADVCGNIGTATKTFTVNDNLPPVVTPPAAPLSMLCYNASTVATWAATASANDVCSGSRTVTPTWTAPAGNCNQTVMVTFMAADACGNIGTATKTFTVNDNLPPVVTPPAAALSMQCYDAALVAAWAAGASASDNCSGSRTVTPTWTAPANNCNQTVMVTFTAADACGNLGTATKTFSVNDITPPVITAPADAIVSKDENCSFDYTGILPGGTDNCGGILTFTHTDDLIYGACLTNFGGGNVPASGNGITWDLQLATGSGALAGTLNKFSLGIQTNQGIGRAEFTLVAPSGDAIILVGPYCSGGTCDDPSPSTKEYYSPSFYPNSSGYTVWNNNTVLTGAGNYRPLGGTSLNITDLANTVPRFTNYVSSFEELTGPLDGTWTLYSRKQADVNGEVKLTSACIGDEGVKDLCANDFKIIRHWTGLDACGNVGNTVTQTILVKDNIPPVMTCPAPVTVQCASEIPAPNVGTVTATDNCSGTVVREFVNDVVSNQTCANRYTVTRTYRATDACGNVATCTQIITVNDTTPPLLTIGTIPAFDCGNTGGFTAWAATGVSAADNCGGSVTVTAALSGTAGSCGGSVTATFTATDLCGNTATQYRAVTFNPAALPAMTAPANITVACGAIPAASKLTFTNGLSGSCLISGNSNSSTMTTTPPACGGTVTETWTATDPCGRPLASVSRLITVSPAVLPTMTAPANITVACGAIPAASTITFSNNQGGGCLISGNSNSSTFTTTPPACGGTVTETWTATDPCGRPLAPVSRRITVSPATLPVMTAPANVTVACSAVPAASTLPYTNGLTGGCLINGTSSTSTLTSTPPACGGTVTETWTATDPCGRPLASVSRLITVSPAALPTMTAPANITVACGAIPAASTLTYTNGLSGGCLISGNSNSSTLTTIPPACGGTVTETWTAADPCGRPLASVSRLITVSPAALPAMTAPANITVACGAIPAASTLPYTNGLGGGCLISGNSNSSTFTTTPPTCGGTVTETWTATDACGRALAPVTRLITVSPAALPVMTAPANITVSCGAIPAASTLTYTNRLSGGCLLSGNSNSSTFTITPPACGGTVTESWTASDACGRTLAPVSRTITVLPAQQAQFAAVSPLTVNCDNFSSIQATALSYTNNQSGICLISGTVTGTITGTYSACNGTVHQVWSYTDPCGRVSTQTQTITITDNVPPVFGSMQAETTVECSANKVFPSPSVTDNCDPAPALTYNDVNLGGNCDNTSATLPASGNALIRNFAVSGTGKLAKDLSKITLQFEDNQGKGRAEFTLISPSGQAIILIGPYCEGGYCDNPTPSVKQVFIPTFTANPSDMVWNNGNNIPTGEGTYRPFGGDATTTPNEGYIDADIARFTGTYVSSFSQFTGPMDGTWTLYTRKNATFNGDIKYISSCLIAGCDLDYTIVRTWTATDACNNSSTATQTMHVVDRTPPVITCPVDIYSYILEGQTTATVTITNATATDTCSARILISGIRSDGLALTAPYPLGTTTITWTATDECGNVATCTQKVVVELECLNRTTPPHQDGTVPVTGTVACLADATPPAQLPVVKDVKDKILSPTTASPVKGGTYNGCEGTVTYKYTYEDCAKLTFEWTYTYTIERLDFTMPDDGASTVSCIGQAVTPTVPEVKDNCGNVLTPTGPALGGIFNGCEGTKTYSYTFTDCEGNSHAWKYTYTIERQDFTMPANDGKTIACPSEATAPTLPRVTDQCGNVITPTGPVISMVPACEGAVTYTYTFTDCEGNTHSWVYTYTIDRTAGPIPEDMLIVSGRTVECVSQAVTPAHLPIVKDGCGTVITAPAPVIIDTPADLSCGGTREYRYVYADCTGMTYTWSFVYSIIRTTKPAESGGPAVNHSQVETLALAVPPSVLPVYKDVCGAVLQPSSVVSETNAECGGTVRYNYRYTDCAGLTSTWTYTYTVIRTTLPAEVGGPVSKSSTTACFKDVIAPAVLPVIKDVAGVTLQPSAESPVVAVTGSECLATVTYTYKYVDCAGLTFNWVYTWTVNDNVPPVFTVPADVTIAGDQNCNYNASPGITGWPTGVSDNCTVTPTVSSTDVLTAGTVAGTRLLTRTWTVSDNCGNKTIKVQKITITGGAPPVLVLRDGCAYLTGYGMYTMSSYDILQMTQGSSGGCGTGALSYTLSPRTFNCSQAGRKIAVVVTASDGMGNTVTGTAYISVADTIRPVALCKNITVTLDAFGQAFVTQNMINNGSYDNCSLSEVTLSKQLFTVSDIGVNNVLLKVKDPTGNTAYCQSTVTVNDQTRFTVPMFSNMAPTIGDISDVKVMDQPLLLQIPLSNITPGEANSEQKVISVKASSNNPDLVKGLEVQYTSGTTGKLVVSLAPGYSGSVLVTLTVKDDGGTANGGTDTTYKTFNITVENSISGVNVAIFDENGIAVVTSTQDLDREVAAKLWPNPTPGPVNIELTWYDVPKVTVSVFNMLGVEVFNSLFPSGKLIRIDLGSRASGMYMVKIQGGGRSVVKKVTLDRR